MKSRKQHLVSARCRSCRYFWHINESSGYMGCEYILHTGRRRPCPAGDACTVYRRKGRPANTRFTPATPWRWTPSRISLAQKLVAEGLTYRQAAEKMGTTKEALRHAVQRAKQKEKEETSNG